MTDRDYSAVLSALKEVPEARAGHQDVLHAVVSALAADDMIALEPHFSEDVELHIHGFAPIDGSWVGRANVIAAAARNYQKLAQQDPRIETMVEQADHIVWLLRESGYLRENNQRYELRGVIWWTFQESQIRRVEEFIYAAPPA